MLVMAVHMLMILPVVCVCIFHGKAMGTGGEDQQEGASQTLYFLSLLPYPDSEPAFQPSWDEGPSLYLAEQLAVEHINNKSDLLPDYKIELLQADGGCNIVSKALVSFVDHVIHSGKQIVGIVGPGCSSSSVTIAPLIRQERASLINLHFGLANVLQNRNTYPNSFGMRGSTEPLHALLALIRHNNWTRVATLYDESRIVYYSFQLALERALSQDPTHNIVFSAAVYDSYIPLEVIEQEQIRIVVLIVGPDFLSKIACLGYHRGLLYPKYQIVTALEEPSFTEVDFIYEGTEYYCSQGELQTTANGHIVVTYRLHPWNLSQSTDTGYSHSQFLSLYHARVAQHNRQLDNVAISQSFWAPAFYDAVWVLALSLNNSIEPLHSKLNSTLANYKHGQPAMTEIIRQEVQNITFDGISGRIVLNRKTGHVHRIVDIFAVAKNRSATLVGTFDNNQLELFPNSSVRFIPDSFEDEQDGQDDLPTVVKLTVFFLVLTVLEALILMATQIVTIIHRNSVTVKASSPKLNHLAFIGCYLLLVSLVFYMVIYRLPTTKLVCTLWHIVAFTFFTGGTLVFAVVLVKTWRLYRILVHFRNPGKFISDHCLIIFVLLMASFDLLLNILWVALYHFRVETNSDGEEQCATKHYFAWIGISYGYRVIIVLFAVWYAVLSHNVPTPQKEFKSTNVIFLTYCNILVQAVGLPIFYLSESISELNVIALVTFCLGTHLLILQYLLLLFIPPIWPIVRKLYCCAGSKRETQDIPS